MPFVPAARIHERSMTPVVVVPNSEIVPTVTPPAMFCVVVSLAVALPLSSDAVSPIPFGTTPLVQPVAPVVDQLPFTPLAQTPTTCAGAAGTKAVSRPQA